MICVAVNASNRIEQHGGAQAHRHGAMDGQHPRKGRWRSGVRDLVVERRLVRRHREQHALVRDVGDRLRRRLEAAAARRGLTLPREAHRGNGRRDAQSQFRSVHDARPAPHPPGRAPLPHSSESIPRARFGGEGTSLKFLGLRGTPGPAAPDAATRVAHSGTPLAGLRHQRGRELAERARQPWNLSWAS